MIESNLLPNSKVIKLIENTPTTKIEPKYLKKINNLKKIFSQNIKEIFKKPGNGR